MIEATVKGWPELDLTLHDLAELPAKARRRLQEDGATVITDWIKYGLLSGRVLKVRSGALRDSIGSRPTLDGVEIYQDASEAPYGPVFEYGVDHSWRIEPQDPKGVLRFEVDGRVIYAKYVTHPPQEARPFLSRGVEEKLPAVKALIDQTVKETIRGN